MIKVLSAGYRGPAGPPGTVGIDLTSFGARATPGFDNSIAIENAINSGEPYIYVPQSDPSGNGFEFSGVHPLLNGFKFCGSGPYSALYHTTPGEAAFTWAPNAPVTQDGNSEIVFEDLYFGATTGTTAMIKATSIYRLSVNRCVFYGPSAWTEAAIHFISNTTTGNVACNNITNNRIHQAAGHGIKVSGDGGLAAMNIDHNRIHANDGFGVYIDNGNGVLMESNVSFNDIEGNLLGACFIQDPLAFTFINNHMENTTASTVTLLQMCSGAGAIYGVTVMGNLFGTVSAPYGIDMSRIGGLLQGSFIGQNSFASDGGSIAAIRARFAAGTQFGGWVNLGSVPKYLQLSDPSVPTDGPTVSGNWITNHSTHLGIISTGYVVVSAAGGAGTFNLLDTQVDSQTIEFTGVLTGNRIAQMPEAAGMKGATRDIYNNTTGAFTLTVKSATGSGVAVTQSKKVTLKCNGTNWVQWNAEF